MSARRIYFVVSILVLAALPWLIATPYWRGILVLCAMNVLLALSLNLVIGYTGQLNLGQSAFFGIGAYVSTILVKSYGWNFWLAAVAAVGAAGLLGLALAAFAVRLRGHYLAIASLGFAVITYQVLVNWENVTQGVRGIYGIMPPFSHPGRPSASTARCGRLLPSASARRSPASPAASIRASSVRWCPTRSTSSSRSP